MSSNVSGNESPSKQTLNSVGHFTNGIVSSCAMMSVAQPLDTIKIYLISGNGWPPLKQWYRGFVPNLWGVVPSMSVAYATNGICQELFKDHMTLATKLGSGLLSGVTGAVPSVVFSRWAIIQQIEGGGAVSIAKMMIKDNPRNNLRGYFPTVCRDSLVNTILFGCVPLLQEGARSRWGPSRGIDATVAFISGFLAGGASTPFDIIKTRMQTNPGQRPTFFATARKARKEISAKEFAKVASVRSLFVGVALVCLDGADKVVPEYLPKIFHK